MRFAIPKNLTFIATLCILLVLPLMLYSLSRPQDLRQNASSRTGRIMLTPAVGTYPIGKSFMVDVVIGSQDTAFNAASANVTVSNTLSVESLSITPASSGGCNFTFIGITGTPTVSNPSFLGAILNGSTKSCTLYTLEVKPLLAGAGQISFTNGSVKQFSDSSEIFQSFQSGLYTIVQ